MAVPFEIPEDSPGNRNTHAVHERLNGLGDSHERDDFRRIFVKARGLTESLEQEAER